MNNGMKIIRTGKMVEKEGKSPKPKKRNCKWLANAGKWKINKYCSLTDSYTFPWKTIPPARDICTDTCNSCLQ